MNTATVNVAAPAETFVAGYIRLTREESIDTGLSAPAQRKGIHSYCESHKLAPIRIFEETKAVGGDVPFGKRQACSQLIDAIKAGQCCAVIVRDLDRLTRDIQLSLELVALCKENGVTIHTFSGPLPLKSASDLFSFHVRSAASEFEKNQVGDRVRRAKAEAIAQGRWPGGPAPYGFISQATRRMELIATGMDADAANAQACTEYPVPNQLVAHPKEADTLRLIYKLALEGKGSRRIIKHLNENGYRTRTSSFWSTERLSRTLQNPAAAGQLMDQDGKLHKANHEAIITLDQWQQVQKQRRANTDKMGTRGTTATSCRKYHLSNVLRCSCGAPMVGKSQRAGTAGRYHCSKARSFGKHTVNGCQTGMPCINADKVHAAFWQNLRDLAATPDLVDRLYEKTRKILAESRSHQKKAQGTAEQLAQVERQLRTWYMRHDAAMGDAEQEAAWKRIVELTETKKKLETAKAQEESAAKAPAAITKDDIRRYLASITDLVSTNGDRTQALVKSLVEHHGLSVQMKDGETMEISLSLASPGVQSVHTVPCSVKAEILRSDASAWVKANQGKHLCSICGEPVQILKRHYWLGIPKHHHRCWNRQLGKLRGQRPGLINASELARKLGIGRTTIGRWIASGRLPHPVKREGGMLWWDQSVDDR